MPKKLLPVFVYGTLKQGHGNHFLIRHAEYLGKGALPGILYDLGGIPGFQYKDGSKTVKGEVYRVTRDVLHDLDQLEGEGYLYERVIAEATLNSGDKMEVWVYQYMHINPELNRIDTGIWPKAA